MSIYHKIRLPPDPRRDILWQSLWRFYFSKLIGPDDCVLDLGCGHGGFINAVVAKRRIAIDLWPESERFLDSGVELKIGRATDLDFLPEGMIDFAFASNLVEHISQADFGIMLNKLRSKLSPRGTLTLLQPNYRYAYREYFDDYTHITIYSHISLGEFLMAHNYELISVRPRFLPLTLKSKTPVIPLFILAYLTSPFKPLGKQMLVRARPNNF